VDLATSTSFTYDALARVTGTSRVLDGTTYTMMQSYDALDRPAVRRFPDQESITFSYNEAGWLRAIPGYLTAITSSRRQPAKASEPPTEPSPHVEEVRAATHATPIEPPVPPPDPGAAPGCSPEAAPGRPFAPWMNSHDGEVFRRGKDRIPRTRLTLMYGVVMRDGAERLYARLMNIIDNGKDADLLRLVEIMGDRTEGRPTVRVEKQTRRVTQFIGPGVAISSDAASLRDDLSIQPRAAADPTPPIAGASGVEDSALDPAVAEDLRDVEPMDLTIPEFFRRPPPASFDP
jgi:hypothetical protein